MSETIHFWQGGRKIEVQQDEAAVTIHAEDETAARTAAARAGVDLREASAAAPGLIKARVTGDRDASMLKLRSGRNIVHHVYRDRQAPDSEYLITETFFIKFKDGTPEQAVHEYFASEHLRVEREMGDNTFLVRVTSETGKNGAISDLRVRVDIRHTYVGDLRVELTAPDGSSVVLHNNTGGSSDNLVRTYAVQDTPALRPLIGRSIRGTWKLRVRDTARFDIGRLNEWRIAARLGAAVPAGPQPAAGRAPATT